MLESARSWAASHRDVSRLVREAERFSVRLPVVGKVAVPRPEQMAFYGALGVLAAVELIDWPVAVALGVGHAVTTRHIGERPTADTDEATREPATRPARKAPAKKAPARKAPAKKALRKAASRAATAS